MLKTFLRKLRKIFKMHPCDPAKCICEIETNLGIELALDEENFAESLCLLGHKCEEISLIVHYNRRKSRLKKLLSRAGYSDTDSLTIIKSHTQDLKGVKNTKDIFDSIQATKLSKSV